MESTFKIYTQEKLANPSLELTAKLVNSEYRWIGSNNATNPTLNVTSGRRQSNYFKEYNR